MFQSRLVLLETKMKEEEDGEKERREKRTAWLEGVQRTERREDKSREERQLEG